MGGDLLKLVVGEICLSLLVDILCALKLPCGAGECVSEKSFSIDGVEGMSQIVGIEGSA